MWRLLIVVLIALAPMGLSYVSQEAGYRVTLDSWLPRPEKPPFALGQTPPPDWQERAYLAANPDVADAVRAGIYETGYEHYRMAGLREGRTGGFPAQRAVAELPAR
ncbi:hypothetical protein [Azospirillum sp. sgz301742]